MAYNNYYPMNYYPQAQMNNSFLNQNQQQNNNGIIWVSGDAGAKAYLVAPNTSVVLFDSESQTIYIKSADASGMPSIRILDYTFRDSASQGKAVLAESDFARQSDVDYLKQEIEALRAKFGEMEGKKK